MIEWSLTLAMKSTSVGSLSAVLPRFSRLFCIGDDLAAGGGGVKDHVVRAGLGLDVRAGGNQFRQARSL